MRILNNSHSSRYRSVKYKLSKQSIRKYSNQSLQRKTYLPITIPSPSSQLHNKTTNNHNKWTTSNISDYKKTFSTFSYPESQKMKKSTYLETFAYMLHMEKNKFNLQEKQMEQDKISKYQQEEDNGRQSNNSSKLGRVLLPTLNQLDSYFTVLDNINLPITYLTSQIPRITQTLQSESQKTKQIAVQLKQIQKNHEIHLKELLILASKGFTKLRSLLRTNKVHQQQQLMKNKNALEQTREYLPNYYEQLDKNKQRIVNLQETIFKDRPFELEQRQEFISLQNQYF